MKQLKVKLTLLQGMLGTKSANPELLRDYIASKHPEGLQDDEMEVNASEELAKGTTVFNHHEDGSPFIFDYQIKGFFKDSQGALNRIKGQLDGSDPKMKAYKKVIDGLIFITEREITPVLPDGTEVGICERPLRAATPQGERVSIARSEEIPAGSTMTFTIECLEDSHIADVRRWLDYGKYRGLGAWRNSGKGSFTWNEL